MHSRESVHMCGGACTHVCSCDYGDQRSMTTVFLNHSLPSFSENLEPMNSAKLWSGICLFQCSQHGTEEGRASDSSSHTCEPSELATEPTPKPSRAPEWLCPAMCSSNMQVNSGSPISISFFGLCSLSYTMEKIKTPHSPLAFGKLERRLKICW